MDKNSVDNSVNGLVEEERWDWITPFFLALRDECFMFIQSAQAYDGGNEWKKQIIWSLLVYIVFYCGNT